MFCQVCGTLQSDESEYCDRCNQKLLVLSGPGVEEIPVEENPEENFSFDEHLLERISILEEVMKRTAEAVREMLTTLQKQEKNILINHTGLSALAETLDTRGALSQEVWNDLWEKRELSDSCWPWRSGSAMTPAGTASRPCIAGSSASDFYSTSSGPRFAFSSSSWGRPFKSSKRPLLSTRTDYALAHFLGETRFNEGDAEAALAYFCSSARGQRRTIMTVWSTAASSSMSRVIWKAAEALLVRGASIYPDAFLPIFCLGVIRARRGEMREASVFLNRGTRDRCRSPGLLPSG